MKFIIQVEQRFNCTYIVEADSREEAWDRLIDGDGECDDQQPEDIMSTVDTASIEVSP